MMNWGNTAYKPSSLSSEGWYTQNTVFISVWNDFTCLISNAPHALTSVVVDNNEDQACQFCNPTAYKLQRFQIVAICFHSAIVVNLCFHEMFNGNLVSLAHALFKWILPFSSKEPGVHLNKKSGVQISHCTVNQLNNGMHIFFVCSYTVL